MVFAAIGHGNREAEPAEAESLRHQTKTTKCAELIIWQNARTFIAFYNLIGFLCITRHYMLK